MNLHRGTEYQTAPRAKGTGVGVVGLTLSTAGAVAMWDAGPGWYSLAVIAIAMPYAWAGGRLHGMQLRARADG